MHESGSGERQPLTMRLGQAPALKQEEDSGKTATVSVTFLAGLTSIYPVAAGQLAEAIIQRGYPDPTEVKQEEEVEAAEGGTAAKKKKKNKKKKDPAAGDAAQDEEAVPATAEAGAPDSPNAAQESDEEDRADAADGAGDKKKKKKKKKVVAADFQTKPTVRKMSLHRCNVHHDLSLSRAMAPFAYLNKADADEGVDVSDDGLSASCSADDAWLGLRGRPGVLKGAYQYEVELKNDCLLRLGWAAAAGRRALGTDERSFGFGGTGMKSNAGRFEKYGEMFEGMPGAVITCLLDRREPRRHTISYCLNGKNLGVAFRLPPWLGEVPLYPAVCGREDWQATCRFRDLRFPHGGYRDLDEACSQHVVTDDNSVDAASAAAAVFAAAPFVEERELRQLDVPNENLIELRSEGEVPIDGQELKSWLVQEYGISSADFHAEYSDNQCMAVLAFPSHRVSRSMANAPPPKMLVRLKSDFSEEAEAILALHRPSKGATTDAVARRLIAGALDGDTVITKEQLRQIRAKKLSSSAAAGGYEAKRKPPPAPPMPTLGSSSDSESASSFKAPAPEKETPPAKRPSLSERQPDTRPKDSKANPGGSRLLQGALRGVVGASRKKDAGPKPAKGEVGRKNEERAPKPQGPRNALWC
ncbi:Ddx1 [Symbiodinium sp. KB8]|nr:Ddx1 [Symbiodinium sp. KB8]